MANTKSKKTTTKKSSSKPKTTAAAKTDKSVKASISTKTVEQKQSKNPFKGFFARKCDKDENILTIFKSPRIWGALLGEVIGTMFLSIVLLTLGYYQPLYIFLTILGITMVVFALSGAHLNPAITAGMMASRRVSAIRGVLYIIAQVIGAWLGLFLVNLFRMSVDAESQVDLPVMAEVGEGMFWVVSFIELVGALILGFFFARAQAFKRSTFTYAAVVAGGAIVALLFAVVVSSNFLALQNNFALNPAIAIMYQILPTGGENFVGLLGDIALALCTYVVFPMVGAIAGTYLADAATVLAGEELK